MGVPHSQFSGSDARPIRGGLRREYAQIDAGCARKPNDIIYDIRIRDHSVGFGCLLDGVV